MIDPKATTLLVIDDDPDVLRATARILEQAGYKVITGATAAEALSLTRQHVPAILLLDVMLPDGNGVEVAKELKSEQALAAVYVILLSGVRTSGEDQASGLSIGLADGYITRPFNRNEFLARIDALLRLQKTQHLLRESHEIYLSILESSLDGFMSLSPQGDIIEVNPAYCEMSGYTCKELIGMNISEIDAAEGVEDFINRIKGIFKKGHIQLETRHRCKSGAFLEVEVSATYRDIAGGKMYTFFRDITERKRMHEDLQQIATTDELTGLINRRHFMELAHNELRRAIRLHHSLSIALIDIDYFKQVNDTHGHAAGDRVLQILAQTVQKSIREIDVFARLGGDEFVLLLPGANGEQAYAVVERARLGLAAAPVSLGGEKVVITISSGIASLASDEDSFKKILGRADRAMYQSKAAGRNRVTVEID
jgi:diguanylate cyclase (GGDEF)-like protein/PAS domain S-box-containing protein